MAVYLLTWSDKKGNIHSKGVMSSFEFMEKAKIKDISHASVTMDTFHDFGYVESQSRTPGEWARLDRATVDEFGEVVKC